MWQRSDVSNSSANGNAGDRCNTCVFLYQPYYWKPHTWKPLCYPENLLRCLGNHHITFYRMFRQADHVSEIVGQVLRTAGVNDKFLQSVRKL